MLQKMEDLVGRDGEAAVWDPQSAPAAAKSYYLRVLRPLYEAKAGLRSLREMHTLCVLLDHLALGRTKAAADVTVQRLCALELAAASGNWEKASKVELIPSEDATLVSREMELGATRDVLLDRKISGKGAFQSSSSGSYQYGNSGKSDPWSQKGNGKGKNKGKDKDKGKGKGKDPWYQSQW